jgi:hypothetical protein
VLSRPRQTRETSTSEATFSRLDQIRVPELPDAADRCEECLLRRQVATPLHLLTPGPPRERDQDRTDHIGIRLGRRAIEAPTAQGSLRNGPSACPTRRGASVVKPGRKINA